MTEPATAQALWKLRARHYQLTGGEWLAFPPKNIRGRILADPPGFGKSRSFLVAARMRLEAGLMANPLIPIVTTSISRGDWKREAAKFWPELKVHVIGIDDADRRREGRPRFKGKGKDKVQVGWVTEPETDEQWELRSAGWKKLLSPQDPTLLVVNYDVADRLVEEVLRQDVLLDFLGCDEAHTMKYAGTAFSRTLRPLIGRSSCVALLTGTPIHNKVHDLHNLLDICALGQFKSKFKFAQKYFQMRTGKYGTTIGELLDKAGLQRDIGPYVLARSVTEAYGELPARIRELKTIRVPGTTRISPASARKLKDGGTINTLLRHAAKQKLAAAAELIRDLDEPVVAYTYEKAHAQELYARLMKMKIKAVLATGDTAAKARDQRIEEWKAGSGTVLVCTMDAVRESATLVRASAMVFVDVDWLPGKQLQCEGRIDPARQPEGERRPARYYYVVIEGGPDEVVIERVVEKITEAHGIIGGGEEADRLAEAFKPLVRVPVVESEADILSDLVDRLESRAVRLSELGFQGELAWGN